MNVDEVMVELKQLGSDKSKVNYAKLGAGENQFGVGVGKFEC